MRRLLAATGLLLTFIAGPAFAQGLLSPPRSQTQTFVLAYTLRMSDLRAQRFVLAVKALKDVDDDGTAGAEVKHLSRQSANLRRRQAAAYMQIAWILDQKDAPPSLRHWSADTAASLAAPLVYGGDALALVKTEPDTATTLAELTEVQAVKTQADAHQPALNTWLKLTGGFLSIWTAEVGAYAADLHFAGQPGTHETFPSRTAQRLLQSAPVGSPSEVRGDLSELMPTGGGNLQGLAMIASAGLTPRKMTNIARKLVTAYDAQALTEGMNKGE